MPQEQPPPPPPPPPPQDEQQQDEEEEDKEEDSEDKVGTPLRELGLPTAALSEPAQLLGVVQAA
jgi:magnesium chelatase subunit D